MRKMSWNSLNNRSACFFRWCHQDIFRNSNQNDKLPSRIYSKTFGLCFRHQWRRTTMPRSFFILCLIEFDRCFSHSGIVGTNILLHIFKKKLVKWSNNTGAINCFQDGLNNLKCLSGEPWLIVRNTDRYFHLFHLTNIVYIQAKWVWYFEAVQQIR